MKLCLQDAPTSAVLSDFFKGKQRVHFNVWWSFGSNDIMTDYDTAGFNSSGAVYVRDIRSEDCSLFGYPIEDAPNDDGTGQHYDYQGYIRVNGADEALDVLLNITKKLLEQGCKFSAGTLVNE